MPLNKETKPCKDTLKFNFYFGGLRLFDGKKYFPAAVEITALLSKGIRGISGIILANCDCESSM